MLSVMLEQNYRWREKQQFRDIARRYKELPNCAQYGAVYSKAKRQATYE